MNYAKKKKKSSNNFYPLFLSFPLARVFVFTRFPASFPPLFPWKTPRIRLRIRPLFTIRRHNLTRHLLLSISGLTE